MPKEEEHWIIDKRIPIAVIITFLAQVAGALIWATDIDARVTSIERESVGGINLNEKFARLDERLEGMKQNVESMKHQLDLITDHMLKK